MAVLLARAWGLNRKQTGSYFACGSFSNIGSIGALVVFVFLGEEGFAYVPLYKLFEEVVYFAIGFPVAKGFSLAPGADRAESVAVRLKAILGDVFVAAAFVSIAAGGALNLAGVERPEVLRVLSTAMVPTRDLPAAGLDRPVHEVFGHRRLPAGVRRPDGGQVPRAAGDRLAGRLAVRVGNSARGTAAQGRS